MLFKKKAKDEPPGKKLWETYFKELLKKNLQKALEALEKLKKIEPDNSQLHLKMGDLLQRVGDGKGAIKAYHKAANCLISEDHQEKAIAIYKIILRIDSDNSDAKNKMEEVVAYLESLGSGDSPMIGVGIEEMPVYEPEIIGAEALPEAETEGISEDALVTGKEEIEAAPLPPEAETGSVSEDVWPSGETVTEAGVTLPESETEELPAEAWMLGEAETEAVEAPPEADTEGAPEAAWPTGEAVAEADEASVAPPETEPEDVSAETQIDQLGVEKPSTESMGESVTEGAEEPSTILSALGDKATKIMLEKALHKSFTYGENVVEEGEKGDSMFVIKKGQAKVVSNILGKYVELATLKGGDIFGEMVFLSGRPRTASVVANGDLEVLEVTSELLQEVVENNPAVQDRIAEFFYARVQDTLKKVKGQ